MGVTFRNIGIIPRSIKRIGRAKNELSANYAIHAHAMLPPPMRRWFDVVFVCGLYKSGTSLLTGMLAKIGYFDPSTVTNPNENGYGLSRLRYPTRECAMVRRINEQMLSSSTSRLSKQLYDPQIGPVEYLESWDFPIVVKDPRFTFLLPKWISAAKRLQKRICVCFTIRSISELIVAWDCAPYTRPLLAKKEHISMAEALQVQCKYCEKAGVLYSVNSIESIKRLNTLGVASTPLYM